MRLRLMHDHTLQSTKCAIIKAQRKERRSMTIRKQKQIHYYKPDMSDLHGRIGRSIIETIRNTPKPDRTELKKAVAEFEKTYDEDRRQRELRGDK
jgi:hypothetical protein